MLISLLDCGWFLRFVDTSSPACFSSRLQGRRLPGLRCQKQNHLGFKRNRTGLWSDGCPYRLPCGGELAQPKNGPQCLSRGPYREVTTGALRVFAFLSLTYGVGVFDTTRAVESVPCLSWRSLSLACVTLHLFLTYTGAPPAGRSCAGDREFCASAGVGMAVLLNYGQTLRQLAALESMTGKSLGTGRRHPPSLTDHGVYQNLLASCGAILILLPSESWNRQAIRSPLRVSRAGRSSTGVRPPLVARGNTQGGCRRDRPRGLCRPR